SFALNIYFNNGSVSAFPFKLTNILIHSLNGLLVFWFLYLGLGRLTVSNERFANLSSRHVFLLSFGTALLWTVHPIHLTSVLYIVQRMTSLSATFVLLALISYITGRTSILSGKTWRGRIYAAGGTTLFGLMGLFSKENAALLPIYIVIVELTLFSREWPWTRWVHLSRRSQYFAISGLLLVVTVALAYFINYFYPGYSGRTFTFTERLLTEPRILLFYLSLILLPRIDAFGIYHDDIAVSGNLLDPWTTLPSIFAISLLLAIAVLSYKKHKLVSFSILWFFASHLIESTIIALELAHEHRNYLATIGPVVLIMYLTYLAILETKRKKLWWVPVLFLILFITNTSLRAWHWSDKASLYDFESRNHPDSARAQASMGSLLAETGKLEEAKQAFERASTLRPYDASDLINIRIIQSWQNIKPTEYSRQVTLA
ncbi:MAG: tetratricopeptide repeat protein, partial [Acidiferrobacterales bacterium]